MTYKKLNSPASDPSDTSGEVSATLPVHKELEGPPSADEDGEGEKSTNCGNHPRRKAQKYTGGGAYEIYLCDECVEGLSWMTPDDE